MFQAVRRFSLITLTLLVAVTAAGGEVKLPGFFTDHMVLQRDLPVPIWGWADKGEKITVRFAGQTKETTAKDDGTWMVKLDAMKTDAKGGTLTVNDKKINDVLVGEVWLCSGQSNMEQTVAKSRGCGYGGVIDTDKVLAAANYPTLRQVKIQHINQAQPQKDVQAQWKVCTPETAKSITATGFFFAQTLQKELNIPIGLIDCNWGGTKVEPWTPPVGFEMVPELKDIAQKIKDGKLGKSHQEPTKLYNGMVHPIIPFAIRGAIWYQGESNGKEGISYFHKKKALILGWRKLWNQGDFPFYFVQLADWRGDNKSPKGGDGWAKLREAQVKCLEIRNTGMAVICDIGDDRNIHPRNKQDVGRRLALWALAKDYGKKDIVFCSPLYKSMEIKGNKIVLTFDHVGKGLMVGKKTGLAPVEELKDGKLAGFSIAGEDKEFHWAEAKITSDNTVSVSCEKVAKPVAVRYGFTQNPAKWGCNLYSKDGLPASPFRTDDWN